MCCRDRPVIENKTQNFIANIKAGWQQNQVVNRPGDRVECYHSFKQHP